MACSSVPDTSVIIGSETFSLAEIPHIGTMLVRAEKNSLLGEVDLKSLGADFSKLVVFIRIACDGSAGNEELQIKVRVGNKIHFLIERSAVILQEITEMTSSNLKKLHESVFQLLLCGRENIAKETLKLLSINARIISTKAEELHMGFDNTTGDIVDALENTQRTKGAREEHQKDLKRRSPWTFNEIRLEEEAIDALHNSIGALKSLSAIMMNAALVWRQMQDHCKSLASEDMQKMIERAMKYPEEKRIKVWTSTGFKSKAIFYSSQWVALDDVCGTYMEQIKGTRQDLYHYLQENPTIEESRKNVRQLAAWLEEDMKKALEEIVKKDTEAREEIKSLKGKK